MKQHGDVVVCSPVTVKADVPSSRFDILDLDGKVRIGGSVLVQEVLGVWIGTVADEEVDIAKGAGLVGADAQAMCSSHRYNDVVIAPLESVQVTGLSLTREDLLVPNRAIITSPARTAFAYALAASSMRVAIIHCALSFSILQATL